MLGLRNFCVGVSLPGSPICWAFAVFLLERHGGKFFVELEPLIVLFHVGLDFFVLFHVGLFPLVFSAQLFVGVRLSEFYFGLLCVIFC